jgi:hypothetical protein
VGRAQFLGGLQENTFDLGFSISYGSGPLSSIFQVSNIWWSPHTNYFLVFQRHLPIFKKDLRMILEYLLIIRSVD